MEEFMNQAEATFDRRRKAAAGKLLLQGRDRS
jgi:hypothetical protein